jgi:hypothetical protein
MDEDHASSAVGPFTEEQHDSAMDTTSAGDGALSPLSCGSPSHELNGPSSCASPATVCAEVITAHQALVKTLERSLASLEPDTGPLRATLEQQIQVSRTALSDLHALAHQAFPLTTSATQATHAATSASTVEHSAVHASGTSTSACKLIMGPPRQPSNSSRAASSSSGGPPASVRRSSTEAVLPIKAPVARGVRGASVSNTQQRARPRPPSLSRSLTLPIWGEKKNKKHYSESLGALSKGSSDSKILSPRIRQSSLTESFRRLFFGGEAKRAPAAIWRYSASRHRDSSANDDEDSPKAVPAKEEHMDE